MGAKVVMGELCVFSGSKYSQPMLLTNCQNLIYHRIRRHKVTGDGGRSVFAYVRAMQSHSSKPQWTDIENCLTVSSFIAALRPELVEDWNECHAYSHSFRDVREKTVLTIDLPTCLDLLTCRLFHTETQGIPSNAS